MELLQQPVVENDIIKKKIDLSIVDKVTFDNFIKDYYDNKNDEEMCINPNTNIQTQILGEYIKNEYETMKQFPYVIYYLYIPNNRKIVAFAVIEHGSNKEKINTLLLLCSNSDKKLKMEGKALGIYLLDDIYKNYVIDKKEILIIQPATDNLIQYYIKWKSPSLPLKKFNTYGYLVYSFNIDNITDEHFSYLISDLNIFTNVCNYLKIDKKTIISIKDNSERQKKLLEILKNEKNDFNESQKLQLENLISNIKYYTSEDIRNELLGISSTTVDTKDAKTVNPAKSEITTAAPTTTTNTIPPVAESKNGYSFVGKNIFKITQDATNGTCVIPSNAEEVKNDIFFINNTKYLFEENTSMSGGSKSANKKNKITCKKKGGRKHKKSQKHKKGAKKC